ncbi:MAG: DUF1329 domain-containing protein [Parvibaculum sp.]|uniref:DUF1329 domain-containing protein n=1 Tax=Parvibaculum sp. TaxID=2024848 RepID=UPI0025F36E32|nr:DUF1329 domain-containing protein [Parvibaculum sp.]MCE9651200.1 DUF1329 domain-containing protein [Parvibaculum sp.]
MSHLLKLTAACVALNMGFAIAQGAHAASVSDLGGSLTPVGAERAGNAAGTIPEWTGGLTEPVPGWSQGQPRLDPYASDAKLFTIDASNIDQYKDKLSEGQVVLIKKYPGYRMDVYPSRRSCGYSQRIYDRTKANATEAKLSDDGKILAGYGGFLFPLAKTGWEAVVNHRSAYGGTAVDHTVSMAVVQTSGHYNLNVGEMMVYAPQFDPKIKSFDELNGFKGKLIYSQSEPVSSIGGVLMTLEYFNRASDTWGYIPGLRRVKKAPQANYDNPVPGQDNLRTFDQTFMFNGQGDRYDWKLVGKREMYIPYNAAKLKKAGLKIDDIVGTNYPNRDLTRYELHRVWVVEATVKAGERNIFGKRIFYLDEDTWTIVVADLYDNKGGLWRAEENHLFAAQELPACVTAADFYYDLNANRYIADNLIVDPNNENYRAENTVTSDMFQPDELRRMGKR